MVVGATLVALTVVVALSVLPGTHMLTNRARYRLHALQLAQSYLEQQRARAWNEIPSPPAQVDLPEVRIDAQGIVFRSQLRVSAVPGHSPDQLRHLRVQVSWQERRGPREVQHEVVVARVPR